MDRRETVASFSPSRSPNLSAFDIAKVPVPAWDLLKEDEVPDSAYASLPALVDWIDAALGVQGLRLAGARIWLVDQVTDPVSAQRELMRMGQVVNVIAFAPARGSPADFFAP